MYLVLFGIGLLIAAAGFVTIGFGIPINAFSLGNTLIMSGTIGVVGGLILVAIAVAIRQLNRVIEALGKTAAVRHAPAAEPSESLAPPTARIQPAPRPVVVPKPVEAAAPKPVEPPVPEVTMPRPVDSRPAVEPRFPATTANAAGPLDWLRPKQKTTSAMPSHAAESAVVDVLDEAPLSPRVPHRPTFVPPSVGEQPAEPRAWAPSRGDVHDAMPKDAMPDAPSAQPPRAEPAAARMAPMDYAREPSQDAGKPAGKDAGLFDVVWPDARSKPMPAPEPPAQREPKPEPASPQQRLTFPERPAAILKSGVIDGMAYTLYVDGSIEADLPQGTVKFASVDALRAHLEKSA